MRGLFSLMASQRRGFNPSAVEKQSLLRESYNALLIGITHPIQRLRGQSLHNVRKPDTGESLGFEALYNLIGRERAFLCLCLGHLSCVQHQRSLCVNSTSTGNIGEVGLLGSR